MMRALEAAWGLTFANESRETVDANDEMIMMKTPTGVASCLVLILPQPLQVNNLLLLSEMPVTERTGNYAGTIRRGKFGGNSTLSVHASYHRLREVSDRLRCREAALLVH